MDYREQILKNITNGLIAADFSTAQIDKASTIIIEELSHYIVSEMCTAVVPIQPDWEPTLKIYCGTLLTEGKSINTVTGYKRLVERFLISVGKPIKDISVFDIRVWLAVQQQSVSRRTCENYRAYLSAFFTWLFEEDIIQNNPMRRVKPIKVEDVIRKPFNTVEIDQLRSACSTLRDRALIELLLSSGVRVSECANLNISDLDFDSLEVSVREGKGGKSRVTYINAIAKHHIKKYLESRKDTLPYLFITRNKGRISKEIIESDLHRIGYLAGVDDVHPHRCRRTFATNLARSGMSVTTIQMLMGHKDLNTTKAYISLDHKQVKSEYEKYT